MAAASVVVVIPSVLIFFVAQHTPQQPPTGISELNAAIPGWAGRSDFYGYSRYARGRTGLAWELTRDANQALETKNRELSLLAEAKLPQSPCFG